MRTTASARVLLRYETVAEAETARAALAPENGETLSARPDGAALLLDAKEASIGSLVATLEDAFACLVAAQGALAGAQEPADDA